jgi:hypothetical protein
MNISISKNFDVDKFLLDRVSDSEKYLTSDRGLSGSYSYACKELKQIADRKVQSGLLRNFGEYISNPIKVRDSDTRMGMTTPSFGPFVPHVLPLYNAWYPNFPLKKLISVQDMDQDVAFILRSTLKTGTAKGRVGKGHIVENPKGSRIIYGEYPTGHVFGEELNNPGDLVTSSGNLEGALKYQDILMGDLERAKTKFVVTDGTAKTCVFSGMTGTKATFTGGGATVDVDIITGIITVHGTTATKVVASYVWNIENATDQNIPTLVEEVDRLQMQATPWLLSAKWSVFADFMRKTQFGTGIQEDVTTRVLNEMYDHQVRFILDDMYSNAAGGNVTISPLSTPAVALDVKVQDFLKKLNNVSMKVAVESGRMQGNVIVAGNNWINYFDSILGNYKPVEGGNDTGFLGPREHGSIGRYTVFYDNQLPDNKAFMTYRGTQWYDAAYYMGVYLPIAPTDPIVINATVQEGFVSMVANHFDKPKAVVTMDLDPNI